VKRIIDVLGALCLLVILAVPMIVIAVIVRWTSPGPALFWQRRIGRGGKEFWFCKFRTMVDGAEALQSSLEHLNEAHGGVLFKIKRDPRATPFGQILRRTSLDELPQLLNVLQSTMSLVGPRPLPIRDCVKLRAIDEAQFNTRMSVLPGMTGPWQVYGRSDITFWEQMRLDLHYVENQTWLLDLKLLVLTAWVMVNGRGAY